MGKAQAGPQGGFALGRHPGERAANRGSQAGPWTQSVPRPLRAQLSLAGVRVCSGSSPCAVVVLPSEAGHTAPLKAGRGPWSRHSQAAVCSLTELCVLDTHLQGQPPVLSLGTPCSSPQGNLALAQGALGDRQHGSVCVCIYLQHRVCVGACVGVFSEPPPSVLWPMRLLRSGRHRFMD